MSARDVWTFVAVTIVTVLVWLWAAGETREQRTISYARVQFVPTEPAQWIVTPAQEPVTVAVKGSRLAVDRIEAVMRRPLHVTIRGSSGAQSIDLDQELGNLPEVHDTGATILSVEP